MYITTGGLVLKETIYKESSKILTVLTSQEGKITVNAKGARRKGSKSAAGTQLFTYSEMTLYAGKAGWVLTEVRSIEQFPGIREDIDKLALASYFAEALSAVSDEDTPNPEVLQLGLNCLYALSEKLKPDEVIKETFEMRLMSIAGYMPYLEGCPVCGKREPEEPYFSLGGSVHCKMCGTGDNMPSVKISSGTLQAMRYIVGSDPKKIFSFNISEESAKELASAAEGYMLSQLDRKFYTLDYYKKVKV